MREAFDRIAQDLKYTFRQLYRSPGFAIVAIGSLAIGIGANITVYSAAHAVLQQKPNVARPDEIVRVYRGEHSPLPRGWITHFASHSTKIAGFIAEEMTAVGIDQNGTAERHRVSIVSENFFRDLGLNASVGSVFSAPAGTPVGPNVVLSHAYWRAKFGADRGVVGRTIRLNGQPYTIAGVAPEGFKSSQFGWAPQMFVPMAEYARLSGRPDSLLAQSSMYTSARLANNATAAQAEAELLAIAPTLPWLGPSDRDAVSKQGAFRVEEARGVTREMRAPGTIVSAFLMVIVGIVLLIACANLANILLARATGRRREIAIRMALGVSRARLIRQLLTESVVLSIVSGAIGLGIAYYGSFAVSRLIPPDTEFAINFAPDLNVILFATALAIVTGVLFGLAPALQAVRADVQSTLRTESAGSGSRRSRLRSVFLAGQVALAMVLLVTAALFVNGLGAAQSINPGFRSDKVHDLAIDLSLRQYSEDRGRVFYDEMLRRVRALSYVQSAELIDVPPLSGSNSGVGVQPADADPLDRRSQRGTTVAAVTPGYFSMFGIPVLRGRSFKETDTRFSGRAVIANESFAKMFWPDGNAIGKSVRIGGTLTTVVGLVPDSKYKSLNDQNVPLIYLPFSQQYAEAMVLQVRLASGSVAERAGVTQAVQALDPALALGSLVPMEQNMRITLLPTRIGASLLAAFGVLALALAAIGVYGVTAYLVGQRTAEIGIRSALGATSNNVLGLMMRDTAKLVVIGLALGIAGGIGIGTAISGWLFGVGPINPSALGMASAALLSVAALATWIPARRALRVDPIRALRSE